MEHGLRGIGRILGIEYAPSWESYLSQIRANAEKNELKKRKMEVAGAFFSELRATSRLSNWFGVTLRRTFTADIRPRRRKRHFRCKVIYDPHIPGNAVE
jgi:hypothetical protein